MANLKTRILLRDKEVELFTAQLKLFFAKELRPIARELKRSIESGSDSLDDQLAIIQDLERLLNEAGLGSVLNQAAGIYRKEIDAVRDLISSAGKKIKRSEVFAGINAETINQLVRFDIAQIASTTDSYITDTRSILARSILSGSSEPINTLIESLEDDIGNIVKTELYTAVSSFSQAVTNERAQALGFTLFQYIGPEDGKTREFCEDVLAGDVSGLPSRDIPIYSLEEIESMDNGQDLPVLEARGGYNCRHQWAPISEEDARALGWQE